MFLVQTLLNKKLRVTYLNGFKDQTSGCHMIQKQLISPKVQYNKFFKMSFTFIRYI